MAPAGPVNEERIEGALARCAQLGLEPVLGRAARERTDYLAGPDEVRAADLQAALDAPDIDAVWALRGGYGAMRILPLLDLEPLRRRPRPLIGFSDITTLHLALAARGLVSFHGPHPERTVTAVTDTCFRRVLFEDGPAGALPQSDDGPRPRTLRDGVAEGTLMGGNLALAAAAAGTPAGLRGQGCILFLEDVGEAGYRIDRMLTQLRLSGALEGVVGLAFGQFTEVPPYPLDRSPEAVLGELARTLDLPAVLGLPIGHVPDNWTLPLGVRARLDAGAGTLELLENAVT